MRLWHEKLIPLLPRQQLLGQHRECCALRGNGWEKKHATVDYVFKHPHHWLVVYHWSVIWEMKKRGYHVEKLWGYASYRGKSCKSSSYDEFLLILNDKGITAGKCVYPEHDDAYLQECINNLASKGIVINREDING